MHLSYLQIDETTLLRYNVTWYYHLMKICILPLSVLLSTYWINHFDVKQSSEFEVPYPLSQLSLLIHLLTIRLLWGNKNYCYIHATIHLQIEHCYTTSIFVSSETTYRYKQRISDNGRFASAKLHLLRSYDLHLNHHIRQHKQKKVERNYTATF